MKIKGLMTLLLLSLFSAPLYAAVDSFYLTTKDSTKHGQPHYLRKTDGETPALPV